MSVLWRNDLSKTEINQSSADLQKGEILSAKSDTPVYKSIRTALTQARTKVAADVNDAMVTVYWEIGRHIAEAVGEHAEFGKGYIVANLRNIRQFYQTFQIRYALRSELSWTHYRLLMSVEEPNSREFYLNESTNEGWTSRYFDTEDYFHAVGEAYKVVREKLKVLIKQEQTHKAFDERNYVSIFRHEPKNEIDNDFFKGTKFLYMALQKFRDEKAHSLAGLAYDLISRNDA